MPFRASAPAANLGYYRASEWPTSGGSGPAMQSNPTVAPGMNGGPTVGNTAWHPTIAWLLGFVVVELVAFHALSRVLNI
jgi:hypothetical protein